jgi:hypothetical protein
MEEQRQKNSQIALAEDSITFGKMPSASRQGAASGAYQDIHRLP